MTDTAITQEDLRAIQSRLENVCMSMNAMNSMAYQLLDAEDEAISWLGVAFREMLRANIKGVDACVGRLNGHKVEGNYCSLDNYLTEFDTE